MAKRYEYFRQLHNLKRLETNHAGEQIPDNMWWPEIDLKSLHAKMDEQQNAGWRLHSVVPIANGVSAFDYKGSQGAFGGAWGYGWGYSPTVCLLLIWEREADA